VPPSFWNQSRIGTVSGLGYAPIVVVSITGSGRFQIRSCGQHAPAVQSVNNNWAWAQDGRTR
jgi:hypothetical protein